MSFEIAMAESFPLELGRAPKKVRHAYTNLVMPMLREKPQHDGAPHTKRLEGYRGLWRFRVSDDYRLVYRVEPSTRLVTLLMLGPRGSIYDRLGATDGMAPGPRIVSQAEHLLEREPNAAEIGEAEVALGNEAPEPSLDLDRPLPLLLTTETLAAMGVKEEHFGALVTAKTEGELIALCGALPEDVLRRVLDGLWPRPIEQIVEQPVRLAVEPGDIEVAADGAKSLDSFLLNLDTEQQAFLDRFRRPDAQGPWLVKGGPGSGKSTLAVYCIRALLERHAEPHLLPAPPLRVLLTTYTNALVNASRHIAEQLLAHLESSSVVIKTVDAIARQHLPESWGLREAVHGRELDQFGARALRECREKSREFSFDPRDLDFLLEEVRLVLVGRGLRPAEEYLAEDRSGRGRGLSAQQRRDVYEFAERLTGTLKSQEKCLFEERVAAAASAAKPAYDYVFIDEAQDLTPVALRLCVGLGKSPSRVFIAADTNQSIYGNGLSWARVGADLHFAGKARILRRNYRTTTEIWRGTRQIATGEPLDQETLDIETVYRGPWPILSRCSSKRVMGDRLNRFLFDALRDERLAPSCAAVLCRTKRDIEDVLAVVDPRLKPYYAEGRTLDLGRPGVRVMTMHAAKGLQFPVVAVAKVEDGLVPHPAGGGIDESEHRAKELRLFLVACTRAMRHLLVLTTARSPSPFLAGITDDLWLIEDL